MSNDSDDSTDAARKRKKGTISGLALIAFGVVGAIVGYYQDVNSLDYFRMGVAKDYAILHLALWSIAGLCVILWYNRPPSDNRDPYDNGGDGI
jgi:hypothetical protein